ncbi:hypothetical protein Ddc_22093 [Ditylenchus destructor]|nr:hypothetical protein Ddc_22093 [Ditylenchus destructor]
MRPAPGEHASSAGPPPRARNPRSSRPSPRWPINRAIPHTVQRTPPIRRFERSKPLGPPRMIAQADIPPPSFRDLRAICNRELRPTTGPFVCFR